MITCIALPTLNYYNKTMGRPQTEATKKKIGDANRGKFVSEKTKAKMRGSNNPQWAGDKVGYISLHAWVRRRLIKPELCPTCNLRPAYDLANKGVYDRNLDNWEYLCRKCHMIKDGRMDKFHSRENYNKISKSLKGHPKFYKGDKRW